MRRSTRVVAVGMAAGFVVTSTAPGQAATVAQGDASAIRATIGGQPQDSGTVVARHDGSRLTKTGATNPPVAVLGAQDALNLGVLAQDAIARPNGSSAACSGVAGDGGSVVRVGNSYCLTPGRNVTLTLAQLDLSTILDPNNAPAETRAVLEQLALAADQLAGPVSDAVEQATQQVQDQIGDPGLIAEFGAIQSQCTADRTGARGASQLTDVSVYVKGGMFDDVNVLDIPVEPAPNTKLATDFSKVIDEITKSFRVNLEGELGGDQLAPLTEALDGGREQLIDALAENFDDQLAPLQDNVLDVVLNKQVRGDREITVTALDANVLPAAKQFGAPTLADIEIARSHCVSADRAPVAQPVSNPAPPKAAPAPPAPKPAPIPRTVTSGVERASADARPQQDGDLVGRLLLGLVITAGLAGAVAGRRISS